MRTLLLAVVMMMVTVLSGGAALAQRDFSKTQIKATQLGPNVYGLEGDGGRIGLLVGADGVLMVDSQFAPLSERIIAAINPISDGRIKFLVNTHLHGDHVGGNANMAAQGAV